MHVGTACRVKSGLVSEHLAIASVLWNNDSRPIIK